MPETFCCVPLCSNRGGHAWPRNPELSRKWLFAIRRDSWEPKPGIHIVCKKHFTSENYVKETVFGSSPLRCQLKRGSVPSVFSWTSEDTTECVERRERAANRLKRFDKLVIPPEIGNEIEVTSTVTPESCLQLDQVQCPADDVSTVCSSTQTALQPPMSIDRFMFNDPAVHHLTGLESYAKFMFVLASLGPQAYDLNYRWRQCKILSIPNQFFITLIKLRQHQSNFDIAIMFDISEFSVGNIFVTWVNFLYCQWKELDIWASHDLVSFCMPTDFKSKFPTTRIILDGMEVPIKKPSNPAAQQATFSTYKNRNTAKVVVGASPGGLVTHIPDAYGRSTSDRQLVERSCLTTACSAGDSIMVDKGMSVQDMFAPFDVSVNIPTFLKKGNQFSSKTLAKDRKVASKRVHIERIIGLAKTYKILTQPLNATESELSSEIIFICFTLCNFRQCIIPKNA